MIDEFAKDYLHGQLRSTRQALVWKLDGLSEYDVRRPSDSDGDQSSWPGEAFGDLGGLVFGEVFGRPFPEPLGRWQDADSSDLWVTPDESREQIIDFYQSAWEHGDATIKELPIDAHHGSR